MSGFSLRTMMLAVMGCAMLVAVFTTRVWSVDVAHLLLVLAFAIPGGSLAYDYRRTSRSIVIGTCLAATVGTCLLAVLVLIVDSWNFMA